MAGWLPLISQSRSRNETTKICPPHGARPNIRVQFLRFQNSIPGFCSFLFAKFFFLALRLHSAHARPTWLAIAIPSGCIPGDTRHLAWPTGARRWAYPRHGTLRGHTRQELTIQILEIPTYCAAFSKPGGFRYKARLGLPLSC